jgi:Domain of unknown function (DUF4062)
MKIYVSSTYRDLHEHREAVSVILRRMGHQPLGMEEYVAEGMRPLSRCLADIDACDVYVGILAWRYGYVPLDTGGANIAIPTGATLGTTSITEFEFRRAVQCGKAVLMFLLDPEASWPSNRFDAVTGDSTSGGEERGRAIARFREEVGRDHLVGYFDTAGELAGLVSAAVYRAEVDRQMSLESLKIEAQFNLPFIRSGDVADTTLQMITSVIAGQEFQALQINIGRGRDWWISRLYFLTSLAVDLASAEIMVFVGEADTFLGIVNPVVVKERLAQDYPEIQQYEHALATSGPPLSDLDGEIHRRAQLWQAQMATIGGEHAHPRFVTRRQLTRELGAYWITEAIDWEQRAAPALSIQRLIDWPMRFVPVLEQGRFARVVDKRALTEQVARLFVREQVGRATSMSR